MTYADQAATAADPGFGDRVTACAVEQAQIFVNDDRPEFQVLARQVIASTQSARALVPLVAGKPEMSTESDDGAILSAVQAVWPIYGASLVPPE
jgi:hypothetical protein